MKSIVLGFTTALATASAHVATGGSLAAPAAPLGTERALQRALAQPSDVVEFWRAAGPDLWFAKDAAFDARFRERFAAEYEAAASGQLDAWGRMPEGVLALLILLDQYPRNSFRGTPRMYATDAAALETANAALAAGHDHAIPKDLRLFIYLPFAHSERLEDQERSVALARTLTATDLEHAEHHRDIIRRFGRFPHRNVILGRATTAEEQAYLDNGGFKG
jgi:uncharacterized protein (DUF924 family)